MMCQGLGRWRRRVNAAGPSATAAAPRWWRSRCGRHSGRRGDRNAEGVDCVWSRLQRKWLWTELRASFDGTGRVSLSIQPINIPTNPKPARLSATLENSKWRCSPVKPSLPVSLRPTPPKLFENWATTPLPPTPGDLSSSFAGSSAAWERTTPTSRTSPGPAPSSSSPTPRPHRLRLLPLSGTFLPFLSSYRRTA